MAAKLLRFQITGREEDNGDVRFDDLIKQLGLIKNALQEMDRLVTDRHSVYYRVVDLKHSSPSLIELEPVPLGKSEDYSEVIVSRLLEGVELIQDHKRLPDDFDYPVLNAIKDLAGPLKKSEIMHIEFSSNGTTVPLSKNIGGMIDEILGPDECEEGSVIGYLHHLNLHNEQNIFSIYPTSRQPKVSCLFSRELREQVVKAVDQYVEVYGLLRYKQRDPYPYAMTAKEIEVYPPDRDLPTLMDLRGMAPDATGNLTSEEFVEELRSAW